MKHSLTVLLALLSLNLFAATSQAERSTKKFEITTQFGMDYSLDPTQLSLMYFINADNLIGLKAGVDKRGEERQTNFALQFKHFLSNSFYVAPEIFYLNTREDVNPWIVEIFGIKSDYAEYVSMGAGIRFGNQWTWKHFTLGCDWLGIGRRVGTFRKDKPNQDETTYTFMNVIVGLSF